MPPHFLGDCMSKKYYNIAGLLVEMDSFGRTAHQAEAYIADPNVEVYDTDVIIESDPETLAKKFWGITLEDAEYLSTGSSFHRQLLRFDGIMLHSSAVVVNGKAYLFTADCGVGKSTHTSLWVRVLGEKNAFILNDDKPVLRLENGVWYAYGTPWSGKHGINRNEKVPLGGICALNRGADNEISSFAGAEAIRTILAQTPKPGDAESRMLILTLLDKLITQVPIWKLRCNMDPEAAIVAYEAMSGEKWEEKK